MWDATAYTQAVFDQKLNINNNSDTSAYIGFSLLLLLLSIPEFFHLFSRSVAAAAAAVSSPRFLVMYRRSIDYFYWAFINHCRRSGIDTRALFSFSSSCIIIVGRRSRRHCCGRNRRRHCLHCGRRRRLTWYPISSMFVYSFFLLSSLLSIRFLVCTCTYIVMCLNSHTRRTDVQIFITRSHSHCGIIHTNAFNRANYALEWWRQKIRIFFFDFVRSFVRLNSHKMPFTWSLLHVKRQSIAEIRVRIKMKRKKNERTEKISKSKISNFTQPRDAFVSHARVGFSLLFLLPDVFSA